MPELPITVPVPNEEKKKMNTSHVDILKHFFDGNVYIAIITVVIIIDFVIMGLLTMTTLNQTILSIIGVVDYIVQAIFIVDLLVQLYTYRCSFFKSNWRILDFVIICLTMFPLGSVSKYSKFFRAIRVIRAIRAFSHIKYLRFLINVLGEAIPQVAWTLVIQLIVFYCYSVIGTMFFGQKFADWFGSIWKSLYTLFQIMTLESWSMGIARPVIQEYPFAWAYFVSFVILSSFIMMNIVVGIIVSAIQSNAETDKLMDLVDNGIGERDSVLLRDILARIREIESTIEIVIDEKKGNGDNSEELIKRNSIHPSVPLDPTTFLSQDSQAYCCLLYLLNRSLSTSI